MMESRKKSGRMCAYLPLLMPVALCSYFKSTMLAIFHDFCVLRWCNPPPFYILLLLSFILLIILVNAGLFKNDVTDTIANDKHNEFQVVAVKPKSIRQEELEDDFNRSGSDCFKQPKFSALQADNGEDEDINQFHNRVEAFIHKVQVGFIIEHKSLSVV